LTHKKGKVSLFTEGGKERETKRKEPVESSPENELCGASDAFLMIQVT
jgi:hypothetical protein